MVIVTSFVSAAQSMRSARTFLALSASGACSNNWIRRTASEDVIGAWLSGAWASTVLAVSRPAIRTADLIRISEGASHKGLTPELNRPTKWVRFDDLSERTAYAKKATSALSMFEVSAGNSDSGQKPIASISAFPVKGADVAMSPRYKAP